MPLPAATVAGENESEYVRSQVFAGKPLVDCSERIVKDQQGAWLENGDVVYFLERGGYSSETRDLKNSVHCALRVLAAQGRIEVQKRRGALGNKYRFMPQTNEEPSRTSPPPSRKVDLFVTGRIREAAGMNAMCAWFVLMQRPRPVAFDDPQTC